MPCIRIISINNSTLFFRQALRHSKDEHDKLLFSRSIANLMMLVCSWLSWVFEICTLLDTWHCR